MTRAVTSYSTQVPVLMTPLLSSALPLGDGRVFQVTPVSVQLPLVAYRAGPFTVLPVAYSRVSRQLGLGTCEMRLSYAA